VFESPAALTYATPALSGVNRSVLPRWIGLTSPEGANRRSAPQAGSSQTTISSSFASLNDMNATSRPSDPQSRLDARECSDRGRDPDQR
jgi:hypothetical protein